MMTSDPVFTALTFLAAFIFPVLAAACALVALKSLVKFVRDISSDLRGGNRPQ
jgi:hypothetical protein